MEDLQSAANESYLMCTFLSCRTEVCIYIAIDNYVTEHFAAVEILNADKWTSTEETRDSTGISM